MSKLWKIIATCAGAGFVLMVAGILLGADMRGVTFHGGRFRMASDSAAVIASYRETEQITSINIEVTSLRVRIVEGDSFGFDINYSGRQSDVTYDFSNGALTIRQSSRVRLNFGIGGFSRNERITVFIPAGAELDNANIRVSSGSVEVGDLNALNISLRASSGRVLAENIIAENLTVRASSGNITLNNVEALDINASASSGNIRITNAVYEELTAETSSGNINMSGVFYGYTNVQASSGNVTLNVEGAEPNFNYETRASSGTVRVDGSRLGTAIVNNAADNSINARTTSGNIRINFGR